jgi:hypothetical protein
LWDIAIRTASEKNELKSSEDKNNEKNLLFVGCRESVSVFKNLKRSFSFFLFIRVKHRLF